MRTDNLPPGDESTHDLAAATLDYAHDRADKGTRRSTCPLMVLWSEQGSLGDIDPIKVWRDWADYVKGEAIAAGHFLPEEAPTLRRVCCWTF